jgi:hypothetical protein
MGAQLLSMGRGTLPLPPRLKGADPAREQQADAASTPENTLGLPDQSTATTTPATPSPGTSMSSSHITQASRRRPQQGCGTQGATAAKSKDLGFHSGAWDRGGKEGSRWCPERKSGALRASPPSWSDPPAKGFPRALHTPPTTCLHQRRWQHRYQIRQRGARRREMGN